MEKQFLKPGDILAAKYTYGDEILSWKFYKVVKASEVSVQLIELARECLYDDGKVGPHYYSDPYHWAPIVYKDGYGRDQYICNDSCRPIRRKVIYTSSGMPIVKPEEYYRSVGVWSGEPLEGYNLH